MIQEQFVELGARDLIGTVARRLEAILEIKFYASGSAGGDDFATKLRQKSTVEFLPNSQTIERGCAEAQKRFANVKARELVALQNNDATTGAGQQSRGRAPSRTATDNGNVIHVDLHGQFMLAKLRR